MTAGYFSAIKKVKCHYAAPTDVMDSFVVKTWPALEIAPKTQIADMFGKDIAAYAMEAEGFYPRPKVYLADFDAQSDRWALLMDDATARSSTAGGSSSRWVRTRRRRSSWRRTSAAR